MSSKDKEWRNGDLQPNVALCDVYGLLKKGNVKSVIYSFLETDCGKHAKITDDWNRIRDRLLQESSSLNSFYEIRERVSYYYERGLVGKRIDLYLRDQIKNKEAIANSVLNSMFQRVLDECNGKKMHIKEWYDILADFDNFLQRILIDIEEGIQREKKRADNMLKEQNEMMRNKTQSSSPIAAILGKKDKLLEHYIELSADYYCALTRMFTCEVAKTIVDEMRQKVKCHDCKRLASIFAPAEVKRKYHMLVQVYLHLFEETEKVKALAQESDKNAERRDYIPLQCKLKKGDKVDVQLNIYGETLLMSDKKSIVWQGSFTKCSFDYFVPKDTDVDELSCVAMLTVNEVPVGEMRFITRIVDAPRLLNPEIIAHKYNKVFISYSHQDESKVKFLHEGLELGAVPHFFDRKYLKAGDVFPQVIQDYINSADLFILCWSENASKSEYVQKERLQALERAFPQVKPEQEAKLRIYPMSIEPRAELPTDMKNYYHFGEM